MKGSAEENFLRERVRRPFLGYKMPACLRPSPRRIRSHQDACTKVVLLIIDLSLKFFDLVQAGFLVRKFSQRRSNRHERASYGERKRRSSTLVAADSGILSASSNVNFMFSWIALSMSLAIWGPFSSSSARARPGGGSVSQSQRAKEPVRAWQSSLR